MRVRINISIQIILKTIKMTKGYSKKKFNLIKIKSSEAFVVYYVCKKMYGCNWNSQSEIIHTTDGSFQFKYEDEDNHFQFLIIDLLYRIKNNFEKKNITFITSENCFVKQNPGNSEFSFILKDDSLNREEAAYRIKYLNDINPDNIKSLFEIEDGTLICGEKYFELLNKKAAEIMHPKSDFVDKLGKRFAKNAEEHDKKKQRR